MSYYYGGQRSGWGIPLQWIIGAIIAIGGLIAYFSRTSVNPTTGETQRVSLTPDQEIALGMQSAPEMAAQMGGEVPPSDPQTQEVQYIGNRVWKRSDAAKSPYPYHYHLLADRRTVNAFALPGGEVFITEGLLDRLTTEGELAGVLGHETGHVVERHVAQQMAQSQLGQSLVTAVGVASSGGQHPYSSTALAAFVNKMQQLHFSRGDESQADECGLRYMTQAGFDPRAMQEVMQVLQQVTNEQGGRPPQMLQTHPYPEARMQQIDAWIRANYPDGVPTYLANPPLPWLRNP
ncbi:MAG TPA: M48 family metalloprotease [Tepidisphaeraceae bacterium]|jgi:predicted Zn-dependent protease|nr:M48 family metalloprotease [Tepidisphaeraceae bacterium]